MDSKEEDMIDFLNFKQDEKEEYDKETFGVCRSRKFYNNKEEKMNYTILHN